MTDDTTHKAQAIEYGLDDASSEGGTTQLAHVLWDRYMAFDEGVVVDDHIYRQNERKNNKPL